MSSEAAAAHAPATGLRLIPATVRGVGNFVADQGLQYSAAIAYKAIFSIIPLITFAVTVLGVFLRDDERRSELIQEILDALPLSGEATTDLNRLLTDIPSPWSVLGLVALLIALWSASGVMASIRISLTIASDLPPLGSYPHRKLIDLALVLAATIFFVVAAIFNIVSRTFSQWTDKILDAINAQWLNGIVGPVISGFAVPAVLLTAAVLFIYWFVPPKAAPLRYLLPAGILAGIALQAIQLALAWWLGVSASADPVTGLAGGILGFLLTIYISAIAFLVGGNLMYAWAGRPSTPPKGNVPSIFETVAAKLESRIGS